MVQSNIKVYNTRVFAENYHKFTFVCKIFLKWSCIMQKYTSYLKFFQLLRANAGEQYMQKGACHKYMHEYLAVYS